MDQLEFVALTAVLVFGVFAIGWAAGMLHQRFRSSSGADSETVERLARDLAVAEDQRDRCIQALEEQKRQTEAQLAERDEHYHQTIDRLRDAELRLNQLDRGQ